jgi:hypothetical protein
MDNECLPARTMVVGDNKQLNIFLWKKNCIQKRVYKTVSVFSYIRSDIYNCNFHAYYIWIYYGNSMNYILQICREFVKIAYTSDAIADIPYYGFHYILQRNGDNTHARDVW